MAIDAGSASRPCTSEREREIAFSRAVELSGRRARTMVEKPEGYKYKDIEEGR